MWTFKLYLVNSYLVYDFSKSFGNTHTYIFFQKKPMLKGCIELNKIKCVEIVCCDVPIPCSYKYPFQVSLKVLNIKIENIYTC